jgi:hypothetical protein
VKLPDPRVSFLQHLAAYKAHALGSGRDGRRANHLRVGPGSRDARILHLPASVRVYLCLSACDMRKGVDGLPALVRGYLELDAFGGHLFVLASRRRDGVKILYGDRNGFAICEQTFWRKKRTR